MLQTLPIKYATLDLDQFLINQKFYLLMLVHVLLYPAFPLHRSKRYHLRKFQLNRELTPSLSLLKGQHFHPHTLQIKMP